MKDERGLGQNNYSLLGKYLTFFQRELLKKSLEEEKSELYRQRILIMLLADEGKTQQEICQAVNCCATTARHWMLMARTGMAHKWKNDPIGRPKKVNEQYLIRLKELVNQSPQDNGYSFRRWTGQWLSRHLAKEFGFEVNERHINRLLKEMGLSTRLIPNNTEHKITNIEKSRINIQDLSTIN